MAAGDAAGRSDVPSITLHSSWRGIMLGCFGAGAVFAAGMYGVWSVGFELVPGVLFVLGIVLVIAMAVDYPIAARFDAEGVQRRMFLRRQWFAWSDRSQLTRTRPTAIRVDRRLEHGALALKQGRRRYLLVDRLEGADEFDRLVEVVEVAGSPGADVGASMLPRPGEKVPPTWLYRRSVWRPESARKR